MAANYTIAVGEVRPLLDGNGQPLATAGVTAPDGSGPPWGVGLAAHIGDNAGFLYCQGNFAGTVSFSPKRNGVIATHEVTVVASVVPFDWSLGDPV